ncbi:helicase-related protein [Synechococcus sp. BDU 130192]|uniref:helicase-related protein n=1 Tax=Synechococcus sp. BDU 130192 TaxID=2042059 RepID=UPI000C073297|nr:helicase-related protein [Synechococcus sp. BDU 130192]
MNHLTFAQQASHWGRIFEVAVQRGALAQLLYQSLLTKDHPSLQPWQQTKTSQLNHDLVQALGLTDPTAIAWAKSRVSYLLVLGYGLGWTTVRQWLQTVNPRNSRNYQLAGIWCPLFLPSQDRDADLEREDTVRNFQQSFGQLYGDRHPLDLGLVSKGKPARADFLLWLTHKRGKPDQVLCLELSYKMSAKVLADYEQEEAHYLDLLQYVRGMDSRGVFARVCAEVEGENLGISEGLNTFLAGISSRDKPFYKLCQGSSYLTAFLDLLRSHGGLEKTYHATVIAVTNNGLESLQADCATTGPDPDPRLKLMRTLGEAYQGQTELVEDDPEAFNKAVQSIFKKILKALPTPFKSQVKELLKRPYIGEELQLDVVEEVTDFYQPMDEISLTEIIEQVQVTPDLEDFFGCDPRQVINQALRKKNHGQTTISLRDAHAAAIAAALEHCPTGEFRAIALEGNPGIGKTTAVVDFLKEQQTGFLFLYLSPRVVINRDVTDKFAQASSRQKSGILTLTSNARVIREAPQWYQNQGFQAKKDSAVVAHGCDFRKPNNSILYLTPTEEQEIDLTITKSRRYKRTLSDRQGEMKHRVSAGVLNTLAQATQGLLSHNPQLNQIVLTAAIQGYRELAGKTTIDSLSKLFCTSAKKKKGVEERRAFAQKIPTILVMVDEIAGDGAGSLCCRQLVTWLQQEFIEPFKTQGETSPFQVVLILADASLGNPDVLSRYLEGASENQNSPNRVLISPSQLNPQAPQTGFPFGAIAKPLKLGRGGRKPTFHVMTNSFPASQLTIHYRLQLSRIEVNPDPTQPARLHQLIRQQKGDEILTNACREIRQAVSGGAQQIIFFAQDKRFLRDLRQALRQDFGNTIDADEIAILDQNTNEQERLALVTSPRREQVKIFLLTSSGSRGVSFPKADHIITLMPRFQIETALMEVAQLIYRGRGSYRDPDTQAQINGDRQPRKLVMLLQDFFFTSTEDEAPGNPELVRQWLRKTSDLFTLLVMLRSTIHTRIKGDAGLKGKNLAFVPVGMTGDEELLHLLNEDVLGFLTEAHIFMGEPHSSEYKGVVESARQKVEDLFRRFDLIGKTTNPQAQSFVNYQNLEKFCQAVQGRHLLPDPQEFPFLRIPEQTYALGPYWLEDWGDRQIEEQITFPGWSTEQQEKIESLLKQLGLIANTQHLPKNLKLSARELYHLLHHDQGEKDLKEYLTSQKNTSRHWAIALPIAYAQFWHPDYDQQGRKQHLEEPMRWHYGLGRCLDSWQLISPVIPKYEEFPWAASTDKQIQMYLKALFDKKYFVISYELNLLNLILLEDT